MIVVVVETAVVPEVSSNALGPNPCWSDYRWVHRGRVVGCIRQISERGDVCHVRSSGKLHFVGGMGKQAFGHRRGQTLPV